MINKLKNWINKTKSKRPAVIRRKNLLRHWMFPWGYAELLELDYSIGDEVAAQGMNKPGDGGVTAYRCVAYQMHSNDGGEYRDIGSGKILDLTEESGLTYTGDNDIRFFGAKDD